MDWQASGRNLDSEVEEDTMVIAVIAVLLLAVYGIIFLRKHNKREPTDLDSPYRRDGVMRATEECSVLPEEGCKTRTFDCGHTGPKKVFVILYGEALAGGKSVPMSREYCAQCLLTRLQNLEQVPRCVQCGFAIFPTCMVAAFRLEQVEMPFMNVAHRTSDGAYLCCSRMDCLESGGFVTGHWTPGGYVPLFEAGRNVAQGGLIVVSDVPPEA